MRDLWRKDFVLDSKDSAVIDVGPWLGRATIDMIGLAGTPSVLWNENDSYYLNRVGKRSITNSKLLYHPDKTSFKKRLKLL